MFNLLYTYFCYLKELLLRTKSKRDNNTLSNPNKKLLLLGVIIGLTFVFILVLKSFVIYARISNPRFIPQREKSYTELLDMLAKDILDALNYPHSPKLDRRYNPLLLDTYRAYRKAILIQFELHYKQILGDIGYAAKLEGLKNTAKRYRKNSEYSDIFFLAFHLDIQGYIQRILTIFEHNKKVKEDTIALAVEIKEWEDFEFLGRVLCKTVEENTAALSAFHALQDLYMFLFTHLDYFINFMNAFI